jgi:hypothetical protein
MRPLRPGIRGRHPRPSESQIALAEWAITHHGEIEASRAAYDERVGA